MTNHKDIKDYHVLKWRSCISLSVDHFSTLLEDSSLSSSFNTEYVVRIGDRTRELRRLEFRLLLLTLPFFFLLAAFDSEFVNELSVFGVSLSKDNAAFCMLLLISSLLFLASDAYSIVADYYVCLIKAVIGSRHDERVSNFYVHQFTWEIVSLFDAMKSNSLNIKYNPFTFAIVAIWFVSLMCVAVLVQILMLLILFGAVISLLDVSDLPGFVMVPTVIIAICALVFNITCFLLKCPLPFTDISNVEKLKKLEESDPALANEIRMNIARRGMERDRRNSLALQIVALTASIVGPTWLDIGRELFANYAVVFQILLALVVLLVAATPLVDKIEGAVMKRVFQIEDKKLSLDRYISSKKLLWGCRLVLAVTIGFSVFLYFRQ